MGETTKIEWADRTWSPWIGCTKISPACDGCYAEHLMDTRLGRVEWGPHGQRQRTSASYWRQPLAWNREAETAGRTISVFPSLCDPFDNRADPVIRREWFDLMRATPNLLWLLLSKRPQNAVEMAEAAGGLPANAALGSTVEDQRRAETNVLPLLNATDKLRPAFAFLSLEPLLGPLNLRRIMVAPGIYLDALTGRFTVEAVFSGGLAAFQAGLDALPPLPPRRPALGWVITGGETSQGKHVSRSSHPQWFRDVCDACEATRTPYLHKQNGEWMPDDPANPSAFPNGWRALRAHTDGPAPRDELYPEVGAVFLARVGKAAAGRLLDGVTHDGFPAAGGARG